MASTSIHPRSNAPSPPASVRIDEDPEKLEGPHARTPALSEGTFYQAQVAGQPAAVRRHFFSPPDGALADAVNRDADNVAFTAAEEVRISCPYMHALRFWLSLGGMLTPGLAV